MSGWLLFGASWAACAYALRRAGRLRSDEAVLGGGLLACAGAITAAAALGAAGLFRPAPARLAAAGLVLAPLAAAFLRRTPPAHRASRPWHGALWPALVALAAVAGTRLALAAALPLESWDGLSYHAPIVWRWLEQGNFDLDGWSGPQRWFPWNADLLPAWLALLDGGRLDALKLAQAAGLPLLAAAGWVLGRLLAGPLWGPACALALAGLPIAVIHAGLPYVDLLHAAWWLGAAAHAAAWDRRGRAVRLLLWAAGFGLALGAKATLYFMAPLALPLLLPAARDARRRGELLRWTPALALAIAATGGACYLRNWWTQGSPIYPYQLVLAGVKVFEGPLEPGQLLVTVQSWFVDSTAGWLWYPWRETMKGSVGYSGENGFGPLFMAGWFLLPWSAWRAWRARDRAALGFLATLPAVALFFVTLHPTREQRYAIFAAAVPIVALALLLRRLRGPARGAALAAWSAAACFGLLGVASWAREDAGLAMALPRVRRAETVDPFEYYRRQYGPLGEAWTALDSRVLPGETVAVNYGELMLPWAGVPPRAKVIVVGSRASDLPGALWATDAAGWMGLLDARAVRYFALWTPAWYPDTGAAERAFLAELPGRFASLGRWESGGIGVVELFEIQAKPDAAP